MSRAGDRFRGVLARRLHRDTLGGRLAGAALWSLFGAMGSQGLALVGAVATARLLGTAGYGEYGIVTSTVGMLGILAGMGLGTTATKYLSEVRGDDGTRAGRLLGVGQVAALVVATLVTAATLVAAPLLARVTLSAPHLAVELQVGCGLLFFGALSGFQNGALLGLEAFRTANSLNVLRAFVSVPMQVSGVWLFGLTGALGGGVLAAGLGVVLAQAALRRECHRRAIIVSYHGIGEDRAILWRFSFPAFLASSMVSSVTWLGNAMLVNQANGYSEMGVFNAANQWRNLLLFFPTLLASVNLPILSSLLAKRDLGGARKVLVATLALALAGALPVMILLLAFRDTIMGWYGVEFAGRGEVLAVVALTSTLLAAQIPAGQILAAAGRMWLGLAMNAGWAAVFLGVSWWVLSHGWGAVGLGTAYLVAYIAHGIWTLGYAGVFLRGRFALDAKREGCEDVDARTCIR